VLVIHILDTVTLLILQLVPLTEHLFLDIVLALKDGVHMLMDAVVLMTRSKVLVILSVVVTVEAEEEYVLNVKNKII
jgi:hypothetical protein